MRLMMTTMVKRVIVVKSEDGADFHLWRLWILLHLHAHIPTEKLWDQTLEQ
jgi:hypothetical protein